MWIIANWKSNKTIAEALDWISKVGPQISKANNFKIVVCPTFDALSEVKKAITVSSFPLLVGAQDLSPFEAGAFTGEESAQNLSELISLAILGHSERRQNFEETDKMVTQKTEQALGNNITPLVCVQSVETPVPKGCKLVAFEPVFAVGTGNPDTPEDANKAARGLKGKYGRDLEVLYGGSVTWENVKGFIGQPDLAGVLVGKASLDAEEFTEICRIIREMV